MAILHPTVTEAGLAAAFNAQSTGIDIALTHIAFGTGSYDPIGNESALVAEVKRLPIAAGSRIKPDQIRISAIWQSDVDSAAVSEIGFFAGDLLFAVISRVAGGPYVFKTPDADLVFSYDWTLSALPADSITVLVDTEQSALLSHITDPNAHPQYVTWAAAGKAGATLIPMSSPFQAAVGGRYCLLSDAATATLPPTAGLAPGDAVAFVKVAAATQPLVTVEGTASETITFNGITDTGFYLDINAEVIVVWNGAGWEV